LARVAITSLAFMLVEVPLPVWKMSSTNCASSFPVDHLVGGALDGAADLGREQPHFHVGARARLLDGAQRVDEAPRKADAADREVLDRALRLRAIKRVVRGPCAGAA
jgi:hypothetical protein